jgi:hypothetical protein
MIDMGRVAVTIGNDALFELARGATLLIAIPVVVGTVIGTVLGVRLNVFSLLPTIILVGISTAVGELARGNQASSAALTVILVAAAIQGSYLVASIRR